MCGIFGVFYKKSEHKPSGDVLQSIARELKHRGPDSSGIYAEIGIGLVHTRLSLLDLNPRSNQPFWDRNGRYCLVYNGEIYNFGALRHQLEQQGVTFRTTSDTEVLLESLVHYGAPSVLPRLEGMFAFGLFDKHEKSLIIARDRFGIKPLYVYDSDDVFIFGSEIKAFEHCLKLEPDLLSISSYIGGFGGPSKQHTFFKGIRFVNPGTFIEIRRGAAAQHGSFFSIIQFWDSNQAQELQKTPVKKIVDKVDETLFESVKKHLIADAPVGALCSGGVDSSLVMAMASKIHNNLAIFHANVIGPRSEYEAALSLSRHLKLDLKAIKVDERDAIDMMPRVMAHYEHPFTYHCNSVPFLRVSELVRENGVKAILSGEGSDECYLGYDFLSDDHTLMFYRRIPHYFYMFMRKTPKLRVLMGPEILEKDLLVDLLNGFEVSLDNESVSAKLSKSNGQSQWSPPASRAHLPTVLPSVRKMRSLQMLQYHLRTLLHRNDCLGMAASIECRFPFLDHESVKLAVNMPYSAKMRFGMSLNPMHRFVTDKWVIRQVARRYLPPQLSERRKLGFPYPTFQRIRISPSYFCDSPVADIFRLSARGMEFLLEKSPDELKLKLFHLDVWSRVCLYRLPQHQVLSKLKQYVSWPAESAEELPSRTEQATKA